MAASRERLFLIDGYSNIFRAYYAIRNLSNSKGQETNAVYGFVNMLRKLMREEAPELIGVALDVSGDTLRKERYEEYKANRKPMPDDLVPQIPWIRQAIEAYRIPIREEEGYEADDVLGTLAAKAAERGYEVVLVSADKDLMQLVSPHVKLYHTGRDKLYGPEEVEEDFGVRPERVVDVLALEGDSSDNVPGVKGIGRKGAVALLEEFGSLEELLERADEVSRKSYREGLHEHRAEAELSKELVTIHTDLPVEFEPEEFRHQSPDAERLKQIYRELEFFSLVEELDSDATAAAVDIELPVAEAVADVDAWRAAAAELGTPLVLHPVERASTSAALHPEALGLAVAAAGDTVPLWADFRCEGMAAAVGESLAAWADDPSRELVGHDVKEVLRLCTEPPTVRAALFDTMLVSHLASPVRGLTLEEVAFERFQHKVMGREEGGWGKEQEPMRDSDQLFAFVGERLELVRRLAEGLRDSLEDGVETVYRQIEEPLVPVVLAMEERGVELDVELLTEMSVDLAEQLEEIEAEIYEVAGERFNIGSPKQLGVVMFENLGYPVIKKTKKTKSYSTSAGTLEELATRGYPLPELVLRHRELAKLKSTYVDALPLLVEEDGRVHTRYNQAGAATGRLSSSNPNLQNIPVRTELGQEIRRAFRAPQDRLLVVADYSQIELRVLAHIAEEPTLIEAFREGADIHQTTAASVFGVAPMLVNADQRRAAKVINFGIIYGMSAWGLAQNLGISPGEADRFIKAYFERYPKVEEYVETTLERAEKEGRVETLYGRVRYLPELSSRNRNLRENAKRMAINARIQGTAADLQKLAMIRVEERLRDAAAEAILLLTVHDELVLEVPESEVEAVADLVRAEMEGVAELAVPLAVEIGWGPTWYDAK
ncbi:MAG: DNA polymerase I [Thermoanaerobaculia bacterium]|nr:DNA polymerase I [Thermoanaerobaculia bacterium]